MPYPNQHACRVMDPDTPHDKVATKEIAPGISVILYIKDSKSEAQAYRFDKDKFTAAQAKKWLKDNGIKCKGFEPAEGTRDESKKQSNGRPRYLNININDRLFERSDKGMLIHDAILLAEGTWTDSYQQTPCKYKSEVLEKYSNNWLDNSIWSRHPGGTPRSVDEKIGQVVNPHYDPKYKAVMGDISFHMMSQKSRDIAEMIDAGLVNAVSVELGGTEKYNAKDKCYEAETIDFFGLAVVDKGACETCLIRHKSNGDLVILPDAGQDGMPPQEGESMDIEELAKAVQDLAARVAAIEDKLTPKEEAPEGPAAEEKEMSKKLDDAIRKLSEAEERIRKLENDPKPRAYAGGGSAAKYTKTLISEEI